MKDDHDSHFADSVKRISGIAWQGLEYRVDLLTTELQEDKQRLVGLVALTQIALFSGFMAFLCLNILVLVLFWNTHRTAAAIIMFVFYLAVAVGAGVYVHWRSKSARHPFAATLEELKKDRAALTRTKP